MVVACTRCGKLRTVNGPIERLTCRGCGGTLVPTRYDPTTGSYVPDSHAIGAKR